MDDSIIPLNRLETEDDHLNTALPVLAEGDSGIVGLTGEVMSLRPEFIGFSQSQFYSSSKTIVRKNVNNQLIKRPSNSQLTHKKIGKLSILESMNMSLFINVTFSEVKHRPNYLFYLFHL